MADLADPACEVSPLALKLGNAAMGILKGALEFMLPLDGTGSLLCEFAVEAAIGFEDGAKQDSSHALIRARLIAIRQGFRPSIHYFTSGLVRARVLQA